MIVSLFLLAYCAVVHISFSILIHFTTGAGRCPSDMVPFLHTQLITVASDGLARPGRGRVTSVAFAPNGISWFVRYDSKVCIWGPEISTFPSTFQYLVHELETNHPRKDECIDFVAFGLHDLLLVRYENGNSSMILPDNPAIRSQISSELIQGVEDRLQAGWILGNRTTLCGFDTNRWFIEWRRGSSAEFSYSLGINEDEDLERVKKVLSGVGSDANAVRNNETAQLVSRTRLHYRRQLLTVIDCGQLKICSAILPE